jgi:glycosyltransferase involved in cell wall biosynthesis
VSTPEISIVIPCFNEEDNVRAICAAVSKEAGKFTASYEILLIDNCSADNTQAIIRELCAEDTRIRAIFNNRNYGQMRSPTHGIFQAGGKAVIGMGADFQDPPAMIGTFIEHWRAGAHVVLGQRRRERAPVMLRITRRLGYGLLSRFADYPIIPGATGFGLLDRKVVEELRRWNEPEPFFRGMLVEVGFHIAIVPFDRPARAAGKSKNGLGSLFAFAMSAFGGSARLMLRIPLFAAALTGILTGALLAGAIAMLLLGGPAGTLALFAAGLAALTMVMLSIGLVAEQVRLLAERSRNVPLVIEEERINFPAGTQ